jgi:hypothetical protein
MNRSTAATAVLPTPAKPPPKKSETAIGCGGLVAIVVFVVFVGRCACSGSDEASKTPAMSSPEPAATAAEPMKPLECRLSMDGDDVPVFPTDEGLSEFIGASARGDDVAGEAAFRANNGFWVKAGTRCARLEGVIRWKVRVLEGEHLDRTGYVPMEFAGGGR